MIEKPKNWLYQQEETLHHINQANEDTEKLHSLHNAINDTNIEMRKD